MKLETERLILRPIEPADLPEFSAMNADPLVMQHFPAPMTLEQSEAAMGKYIAAQQSDGFSFYVAHLKDNAQFVGIIGMARLDEAMQALIPDAETEIGWRLRADMWGKGLATEGAKAWLDYAWTSLKLPNLVSLTTPQNAASRRVMEKIGMQHDVSGDFAHPKLAKNHALSQHVLYRMRNPLL